MGSFALISKCSFNRFVIESTPFKKRMESRRDLNLPARLSSWSWPGPNNSNWVLKKKLGY